MTRNAIIIRDLIEASGSHPTAEEIYVLSKESGHRMSLATIYNNLSALTAEGQIRRITTPDQPDRYDIPHVRHDHLLCSRCGRISDLFLSDLTGILEREAGIAISAYDLKLIYVCDECIAKDKKKKNPEDAAEEAAEPRE